MGKAFNENPLLNPSTTPTDVVVRNLRRRLWAAFAKEDAATVLWLYKATRSDWEECLRREAKLADQEDSSRGLRKRLSSFRKNSKSRVFAASPVGLDPTLQCSHSEEEEETACSLLLHHFLPSEPFTEDDFRDPNDSYPELNANRKRVVRTDSSIVRGRFAWSALLGKHDNEEEHEETKGKSDNGLPLTTPLHESARMGNGELVRLLLEQVATSDPNARNGAGQTALHCVAGGYTRAEEQHGPPPSPSALRVPEVDLSAQRQLEVMAVQHAKRAVRVVGRLFRGQWGEEEAHKAETPSVGVEEWRKIALDRMDAALAILSWRNPDDNGQEISTNAVDDAGRTGEWFLNPTIGKRI